MTFDEWFNSKPLLSESSEFDCEKAWNAALNEAIRIAESARNAESTIDNTVTLITTELELLKS